jgi:hypothetical protein
MKHEVIAASDRVTDAIRPITRGGMRYSIDSYKLPLPRPARARVILLEDNRQSNAAILAKRRGYHA